jgi:hypothetical protein
VLVKIVSCHKPAYWYNDKIGIVVDVGEIIDHDGDYEITGGSGYCVFSGDCRPLKAAEVAKTATNKRSSKRSSVKVKRTASSKVR